MFPGVIIFGIQDYTGSCILHPDGRKRIRDARIHVKVRFINILKLARC